MEEKKEAQPDLRTRLQVMKSQAVSQAMIEVMQEQRGEIISRARAKLAAMGVTMSDEEIGKPLGNL